MTSVLLVDDHPLVTERLEARLQAEPGFGPVHAAATLDAARAALAARHIDLVVCDIRLSDGSGLELLAEAGGSPGGPRFLMLSQYDHPQYLAAARSHGAAGYLLKTTPTDEIVAALRRIAVGESAFDPALAGTSGGEWIALSERERQILPGLLRGRTNDEIASDLGISRKTVEVHLTRLFARAGALSRTELALRAQRERWLELPPEPRRRPAEPHSG